MSYPLEANEDLDEEVGYQDDDAFFADEDGYSDEYQNVDFVAMGVDPSQPTKAKPGSEEKVLTLAARYAAGLPLWHNSDCTDHGPFREKQRT